MSDDPEAPSAQVDEAPRPAPAWLARIEPALYAVWALASVLFVARLFYGYMLIQTGGEWSAPLDDVFIHFDYARATARGYPFQWSEGNGFSSGNTSLTYPFVLALGYWIGFRGLLLMKWAAFVACASVVGCLWVCRKLTAPIGAWAKYLIPPAVLSVGALDWSLFSGMENAFHLGVWALVLDAVLRAKEPDRAPGSRRRWLSAAGIFGVLLVWTRPESVVCIAAFAVFLAAQPKANRPRGIVATLAIAGGPAALGLVAQAIANRFLTGEWAAAGAIAKLGYSHPYMTPAEKWDQYTFLLKYVILRNAQHHFADFLPGQWAPWGWLVPIAGALAFVARKVRGHALLMWTQVVGWLALVAMNAQVRWQNERYTMAAVAWLLVLAAMGIAALVAPLQNALRTKAFYWLKPTLGATCAAAIVGVFWVNQLPRFRDQIWFFGRASRNIRDQHIQAGRVLAEMGTRRILVGDAGALVYASDRPAIDLIGLGGYKRYPFAAAGVFGLGASIELIERLPNEDRPDTMAIYPTWWGDLPAIFGRRLASVPVFGNVICGGAEKVIYGASWSPLDRAGRPRSLGPGEEIFDELDVADLMSERAHSYEFPHPAGGFVDFRVLPDPAVPSRDLFDAGRVIGQGQVESFRAKWPAKPVKLVVRTAPDARALIEVRISGAAVGEIDLRRPPSAASRGGARGQWVESAIDVPSAPVPGEVDVALVPKEGAFMDFHVWIVTTTDDGAR